MKRKIFIILNILILVPTLVFAGGDESYSVITKVINVLLGFVSFIGYALAVGMAIIIGIKYVLSGANEKANLKGTFSKYLIGIGLIVLCSTVASIVAEVAGNNTAEDVINKGFELAGIQQGEKDDKDKENNYNSHIKSNLVINASDGTVVTVKIAGRDELYETEPFPWEGEISQTEAWDIKAGTPMILDAPEVSANGWKFAYWALVDANGNVKGTISKNMHVDEFIMPDSETYIQAIYIDPNTIHIAEKEDVVVGGVDGRAEAKVTIPEGKTLAVVVTNFDTVQDPIDITIKRESDRKIVNQESFNSADNGTKTSGVTTGKELTSGKYQITFNQAGLTGEEVNIIRYDKDNNVDKISIEKIYKYNENTNTYSDSNGNKVSSDEVYENKEPYMIIESYGTCTIENIDLNFEDYTYVVNADKTAKN